MYYKNAAPNYKFFAKNIFKLTAGKTTSEDRKSEAQTDKNVRSGNEFEQFSSREHPLNCRLLPPFSQLKRDEVYQCPIA